MYCRQYANLVFTKSNSLRALQSVDFRISAALGARPPALLTQRLSAVYKVTQDRASFSQTRASQASEEEESNNAASGWEVLCVCVCSVHVWFVYVCVCVLVCEGGSYSRRGCVYPHKLGPAANSLLRACYSGLCTCVRLRCVRLCLQADLNQPRRLWVWYFRCSRTGSGLLS